MNLSKRDWVLGMMMVFSVWGSAAIMHLVPSNGELHYFLSVVMVFGILSGFGYLAYAALDTLFNRRK